MAGICLRPFANDRRRCAPLAARSRAIPASTERGPPRIGRPHLLWSGTRGRLSRDPAEARTVAFDRVAPAAWRRQRLPHRRTCGFPQTAVGDRYGLKHESEPQRCSRNSFLRALMQKRPERCRARMRAQLLLGELDLDRLAHTFELDFFGHRSVNRAFALRSIRFHSPSIGSQAVAPFNCIVTA